MINKRLIGTVMEGKKYIAGNVVCRWISLAANITMVGLIAYGGTSLCVILSTRQFRAGRVDLANCLMIILPAAFCFARSPKSWTNGLKTPSHTKTIRISFSTFLLIYSGLHTKIGLQKEGSEWIHGSEYCMSFWERPCMW